MAKPCETPGLMCVVSTKNCYKYNCCGGKRPPPTRQVERLVQTEGIGRLMATCEPGGKGIWTSTAWE